MTRFLLGLACLLLAACATTANRQVASPGEGLCMRGGHGWTDCHGATLGQGLCMSQGKHNWNECSGATVGQGACMAGGNGWNTCAGL